MIDRINQGVDAAERRVHEVNKTRPEERESDPSEGEARRRRRRPAGAPTTGEHRRLDSVSISNEARGRLEGPDTEELPSIRSVGDYGRGFSSRRRSGLHKRPPPPPTSMAVAQAMEDALAEAPELPEEEPITIRRRRRRAL